MRKNLMKIDFLKMKRKGFWLLALLGPIGIVGLQVLNYALRKEYLFQLTDDHWSQYIQSLSSFTTLTLVLGIVLLTSLAASLENETNAWKQLLVLPVSKTSIYIGKYMVLLALLFFSSLWLLALTYFHGISLDLGKPIPHYTILIRSLFPMFAALPILSLQFWLASVCKNQTLPIVVGVFGVVLTYLAQSLPDWLCWKWSTLSAWNNPSLNAGLGVFLGAALCLFGAVDFTRRDVK
jgi:hypothetical protein